MDLLEHQGKALFARHGIPVPYGTLWPNRPDWDGGYVLKAQMATGKRGKRGAIQFADSIAAVEEMAPRLSDLTLDGQRCKGVYVEQRLDIAREIYLAIALDRDRKSLVILASPNGGVDIEETSSGELLRLPIDPLVGLREYHVRAAVKHLDLSATLEVPVAEALTSLYALVVAEDATLAEINPLVLTVSGEVYAADAKVTLDNNAAFRREALEQMQQDSADDRSPLETGVASAGATGIEINTGGEIMAVVSGAGLMMATLDLLSERGLSVRGVVDLGGSVLAGGEALGRVFEAVSDANPLITFFNAYLHTALCDELARMLVEAQKIAPLRGRVVIRLKGRNSESGRAMLTEQGFEVFEDLSAAIEAVTHYKGRS
ncbi:ATP-grasp domain-containing protein [Limibacillus halophilus]|uniref:Succinyl-CoA synthetase beta subunit n=1 Tax=Limibacillus halophilus TaxID=1579333 RepID=A0A839SRV0_9PROT|nr:ATP-grasp domain-containing protein [Limibacillus halophilus]MBB3063745.1 succinyl-CoA synthetase beta subunit [Limibacillus halophilus]